eukprot:jgi/Picre1/35835/NNA_003295.t1
MLKITEYADRLLGDLDGLDWDESIKDMQRNWIGRSEGATVKFAVDGMDACVEVYTTRADTLFGATYVVIAPEHPLVEKVVTEDCASAVKDYVEAAARKSDLERTELAKTKSGVFTGAYAIHPLTGESIPIWVGDYVLGSYGTGAVMAVPAHDARDYEFAQVYNLPMRAVIQPEGTREAELPFTEHGVAVSSACESLDINGKTTHDAKQAIAAWLAENNAGGPKVNYKLRDWLFARQRYWGEPFPVVYKEGSDDPIGIPETDLPLKLPDTNDFAPSGTPDPPLAKQTEWMKAIDPISGAPAIREASTMPQWAGSCWYYLRYIDPTNAARLVSPEAEQYWMPVDLYVGGAEHAVLHLLYARFWHKVLYDTGAYTVYTDEHGSYVSEGTEGAMAHRLTEDEVEPKGGGYVLKKDPSVMVTARAHKMSKSRGNVINPEMLSRRRAQILARVYRLVKFGGAAPPADGDGASSDMSHITDDAPTTEQLKTLHATIKKVSEETEEMRFNTGIAAMMEFVNAAYKWESYPRTILQQFILLLAPYAPHLAEEMWETLGGTDSLAYEPWPEADESLLVESSVHLPVQVNGKVRGKIEVPKGCSQDDAMELATTIANVSKQLDGKEIKKIIFIQDKILNIVAK